MSVKNNVSKMFSVLVIGGTMMATPGASASEDFDKNLMLNEMLERVTENTEEEEYPNCPPGCPGTWCG